MDLVVDSNVLFTFFWKNSTFRKISTIQELELFVPLYALEEIDKYATYIITKTELSNEEFKQLKKELAIIIRFISEKEYKSFINKADSLIKSLPKDDYLELSHDIDFFALALKLKCPIWSNDKLLKKQSKVKILNTKDIILLIDNYYEN